MNLDQLLRAREYLYHLTASANVSSIAAGGVLRPAAELLRDAGRHQDITRRRTSAVALRGQDGPITLCDQTPLHIGNIEFADGWSFQTLLAELNSRVFFWPGSAAGPVAYGRRHFERYRRESPSILRVRLRDVVERNPELAPALCRFNSGSPRCSGGRKSPRGPDTFVPLARFAGNPGSVVEVTFRGIVSLPEITEVGPSTAGPWTLLRQAN